MSRPQEADYTSHVAYARALEAYCDGLENRELLELAAKAAGPPQRQQRSQLPEAPF